MSYNIEIRPTHEKLSNLLEDLIELYDAGTSSINYASLRDLDEVIVIMKKEYYSNIEMFVCEDTGDLHYINTDTRATVGIVECCDY
tara:strand:- start:4779 stop:5036 length:258 start_codon:yes stop_codon:yes gene_type:complete